MIRNTYRTWMFFVVVAIVSVVAPCSTYAKLYETVTMCVDETKTLYLPSSITSLNLMSVDFYSNDISYVQVLSHTDYSVNVKAVKAFSSPIVVRCSYRYFVNNGSHTYETLGVYDYCITVVGDSKVEPTSIKFPSTVFVLDVGESCQLEPRVLPADAEYTLSWSINDTSVATVTQTGLLVGRSPGAADLKVKADNGVYAMLRVVVSETTPDLELSDGNGVKSLPDRANVTYERCLQPGWNSVCLPFAITQSMFDGFCQGCRMATVSELEIVGDRYFLSVNEVKSVSAGLPCLIYAPKEVVCRFDLKDVRLRASPDNSSKLKGTYKRGVIGAGFYKITADGASVGITKSRNASVAPFRAYVSLDGVPQTKSAPSTLVMKLSQIEY